MSARHIHGFNFQAMIRAQHGLITKKNHREPWDMIIDDHPYEIKTAKVSGGGVGLSALKKFFDNDREFTWIIAWHEDYHVTGLDVIDVDEEFLDTLKGNTDLTLVNEVVAQLNTKNFPAGDHVRAREWGREITAHAAQFDSAITWNCKVGNRDNARRWQCSLNRANWKKYIGSYATDAIYRGYDYSTIESIRCEKTCSAITERLLNEQKECAR